jgi:hypothetical protein
LKSWILLVQKTKNMAQFCTIAFAPCGLRADFRLSKETTACFHGFGQPGILISRRSYIAHSSADFGFAIAPGGDSGEWP